MTYVLFAEHIAQNINVVPHKWLIVAGPGWPANKPSLKLRSAGRSSRVLQNCQPARKRLACQPKRDSAQVGAGERNRTALPSLEGWCNSHYTTPARTEGTKAGLPGRTPRMRSENGCPTHDHGEDSRKIGAIEIFHSSFPAVQKYLISSPMLPAHATPLRAPSTPWCWIRPRRCH